MSTAEHTGGVSVEGVGRPLRIAYVTDQFFPGDAADTIQIASMASALGRNGADPTLMLPAYPKRPIPTAPVVAAHYGLEPTFEVLPLTGPYPAPLEFRGVEKLAHALRATVRARKRVYDVLYTRNLPILVAALSATRLPVVYETHRFWPDHSPSKRLLFQALKHHPRMFGLVLQTHRALASYAALGFSPSRLLHAPEGIDARRFEHPLDRVESRRRLGLDPDKALVVYAGHISPEKGLGAVLDAASARPQIDFALVGSTGEGAIEVRAATLPNVRVVPWLPAHEVGIWLTAADILVIPPSAGDFWGAPTKTFQYLAAGRAIVAPDVAEIRELLKDGEHAVLVPAGSSPLFADAIARLALSPARRDELGANAKRAVQGWSWDERAKRVLSFMSSLARD